MSNPPRFTLWLVRHARPIVQPGICYGRSDLPADAEHTQETAQALSKALLNSTQSGNFEVLVSPLQRTQSLANALARLHPFRLSMANDHRLAEMDFGTWEGKPWSDISAEAYDAWTADFTHHRVGDGESVAMLLERVQLAWQDTFNKALQQGRQSAMWVTHAGVIRAMQLLHSGIKIPLQASDWPREAPGFGEWTVLDWPSAVHSSNH